MADTCLVLKTPVQRILIFLFGSLVQCFVMCWKLWLGATLCPDLLDIFFFCPENFPAQMFEDCLYCSLDRKATHVENLNISPGPVLTYCTICVQETRPGNTNLILWMGCGCLVNTQYIQCPKSVGFTTYKQHTWLQNQRAVLDSLQSMTETYWNWDPEDTHQQLCDAEVIRHRHFCSILVPVLSCSYPLWPGPALLGLYFLILTQLLFSPHIRFGKYQIYFGRTPWTEAQQSCAGCRTCHSHTYLNHLEVLQPWWALQVRGGKALGWRAEGNQKVLGSSASLVVFHHSSLSCFYTDTAVCMTTRWSRKREIPH